MSSPSGVPIAAVQAIQSKRYTDAIPLLEAFCRHSPGSSKDHFQAQIWLVKAYQATGQIDRAVVLCRQMSRSTHPKIQAWAQQALIALSAQPAGSAQSFESAQPSELSNLGSVQDPAPTGAELEVSESEPTVIESAQAEPSYSPLSAEAATAALAAGNRALKQGNYAAAIEQLEAFCYGVEPSFKDYEQALTWLAKAYKNQGQPDRAIVLCQKLVHSDKPFIKIWAEQYLQALAPSQAAEAAEAAETRESNRQGTGHPEEQPEPQSHSQLGSQSPSFAQNKNQSQRPQDQNVARLPKAGRSAKRGVSLTMPGVASNLALSSTVTIGLMFGMVLVTTLSLLFIQGQENPLAGLISAGLITLIVNLAIFLFAPSIMDMVQRWLYGTRWVDLSEVERHSPESARVLRIVCQEKKIQMPRLGIIDDQNPTAFTYGSFPNSARLIVSQGLFTYLDDDEVATVYAHELGHIVHWDFAVMTLASTLVQICYLIYIYAREVSDRLGDSDAAKKIKGGAQSAVIMAYVFYVIGEYLLLYLSRTREYYADHFAAEITGNPNGLSRALVKIAYGILEEGKRAEKPSKVLNGTRALGIADPRGATMTGTAYRVATEPEKVGQVFLWDMFNPWASWMELNSTHPLTGKRVRALANYAEQLGLATEFDMARVTRAGKSLNKRKLYRNFLIDLLLYWAEWLGGIAGLAIGGILVSTQSVEMNVVVLTLALFGFGVGLLCKTFVMYPALNRVPEMDVLLLMSDPYASPLRGKPVRLDGQVIGRGDAGYQFGSDLKMQDRSGMVYLRYTSRFGAIGNFLFGMTQAASFVNREVEVTGWFKRGIMPWVEMSRMDCPEKWNVSSYPRFWALFLAIGAIVLAFALPMLIPF
ncbi:MAG: zinc metalloprotease HtpX [Elainella sp. Prado103]|nr:zinc metalloprotease HtpX [Elainella sp. Prado103]